MDGKEKSLLLIGLIGFCVTGWHAVRTIKRYTYAQSQKNQMLQAFKTNKDDKINFQQIKKQNKPQNVIFCGVKIQTNPFTFNYIEREVSNYDYVASNRQHLKRMVGGNFLFTFNKKSYFCDLRDVTIFKSVLNEERKPVKIFKNSTLQPIVSDIQYKLKPYIRMVIYGSMIYDIQSNRFVLYPKFLSSTYHEIIDYLQEKCLLRIAQATLFTLISLGFGYFLIYKPLKHLYKKNQNKIKESKGIKLSLFHRLPFFGSKNDNKLKCIICKKNDSDLVFECGHIEICQNCKSEKGVSKCTICSKPFKDFMKIFVS